MQSLLNPNTQPTNPTISMFSQINTISTAMHIEVNTASVQEAEHAST